MHSQRKRFKGNCKKLCTVIHWVDKTNTLACTKCKEKDLLTGFSFNLAEMENGRAICTTNVCAAYTLSVTGEFTCKSCQADMNHVRFLCQRFAA